MRAIHGAVVQVQQVRASQFGQQCGVQADQKPAHAKHRLVPSGTGGELAEVELLG
ncbi:hypothetical protein [Streptomyces sp. NPDC090025]|uniref:hypothetical protein n=1 Tax=Streptomyces sp. NPDC090025 TaxID=3365922 RepID=UPI003836A362